MEKLREEIESWKKDFKKSFSRKKRSIFFGHTFIVLRWIVFAVICGVVCGLVITLFGHLLRDVTDFRMQHSWMILLMPVGGLFIVMIYRLLHEAENKGTNEIIDSVNYGGKITIKTFPLVFISTIVTHAVGGSAGREGAALQIGGSIADWMGRFIKINDEDRRILVMCGMSAGLSALFGVPFAAIVFAIELPCVGVMHYSALIPCTISSLIAFRIAKLFALNGARFFVGAIPNMSVVGGIETIVIGVLCGFVSVLFCVTLRIIARKLEYYIPNQYVRIAAAGAVVAAITLLIGNQDFNGSGIDVIERCFSGEYVAWYSFLVKIILTAITLGAGFKGGEIIPSFYIGATFGYLMGAVFGLPFGLCTAIGMSAVFCGATNCPLAAVIMCLEMFGFTGMPYYLLAVSISFVVSGKFGLYKSQMMMFSKYNMDYDEQR